MTEQQMIQMTIQQQERQSGQQQMSSIAAQGSAAEQLMGPPQQPPMPPQQQSDVQGIQTGVQMSLQRPHQQHQNLAMHLQHQQSSILQIGQEQTQSGYGSRPYMPQMNLQQSQRTPEMEHSEAAHHFMGQAGGMSTPSGSRITLQQQQQQTPQQQQQRSLQTGIQMQVPGAMSSSGQQQIPFGQSGFRGNVQMQQQQGQGQQLSLNPTSLAQSTSSMTSDPSAHDIHADLDMLGLQCTA